MTKLLGFPQEKDTFVRLLLQSQVYDHLLSLQYVER